MIISVGYRVKSQRGIVFRKWVNSVLKDYLVKGYAINQKKLYALNKTIDIQNKMLAYSLDMDKARILRHISSIYKDGELDRNSTCAESAQVQLEGNREVKRKIKLFNLI